MPVVGEEEGDGEAGEDEDPDVRLMRKGEGGREGTISESVERETSRKGPPFPACISLAS